MFTHYRTQGFVLRKLDSNEADQVFIIYTKDFGKLRVLAKAIRKMTSKLRAGLPLLSLAEIEFIQAKNFKTLTDAILINDFSEIKKDLAKLKIAYRVAELGNELIKGEEKDPKTWRLLENIFKNLDNGSMANNQWLVVYYYFFWNLISLLGYQPELNHCAVCKKKFEPGKLYFSKEGAVCSRCRLTGAIEISINAFKIIREILKEDFSRVGRIKIGPLLSEELEQISRFYLALLD